MIDAEVDHLDAVLLTHEHADQTHGIDDLRAVLIATSAGSTSMSTNRRRGSDAAVLLLLRLAARQRLSADPGPASAEAGQAVTISGAGGPVRHADVLHHGDIPALGFRFGSVAYSPDVVDIPEASVAALQGLDVWIVDALRYRPHPSHFHVDLTLQWIERLKPKRAILTNMHTDLDFEELRARLRRSRARL